VLDLGCGAGHVARTVAAAHCLRVRALDLTPYHVELATRHIAGAEAQGEIPRGAVTVERGDYHDLGAVPTESVDGAYTMETLVHAEDLPKAVAEIFRAVKPGGRVAHNEYEYTFPAMAYGRRLMEDIYDASGMARERPPGVWKRTFEEAGFEDVQVDDITVNVRPFAVVCFVIGLVPALLFVALGLQRKYPNTMTALLMPFLYLGNNLQYVTITARKPGVLEEGKAR
jgi:SAM-dependent methyltransferase